MIYADYDYYKNIYLGNVISEADFPRLALRASQYIDYITMGKAEKEPALSQVKMCCCAAAEQMQIIEKAKISAASESGEKQSESVGSYSVSYRNSSEISASAETEIAGIVRKYLAGTGLLYRGGCICTHRTL